MSQTFEQANDRLCALCSSLDLHNIIAPGLPLTLRKRKFKTTMVAAKSRAPNCHLCQFIIDFFRRKVGKEFINVSLGLEVYVYESQYGNELWLRSTPYNEGFRNSFDTFGFTMPEQARSQLYPGRVLGNQLDFTLLKQWLRDCEYKHGVPCNHVTSPLSAIESVLMVVDVQKGCLVKLPPNPRYVALSYVWGGVKGNITEEHNMQERLNAGSFFRLMADLPTVIRDAIMLVKELGEQYLWVDQLCIVQDGDRKMETLSKMNLIYEHACLTIFAAEGRDANVGLSGVRPNSRNPNQLAACISPGIFLIETPDIRHKFTNSKWATRAWT